MNQQMVLYEDADMRNHHNLIVLCIFICKNMTIVIRKEKMEKKGKKERKITIRYWL